MGEPLRVSVVAPDPLLEAGATSVLRSCPDLAVVMPDEAAQVTVVIADGLAHQVLDVVRTVKNATHAPEVVLVAADLAPTEALHAIVAGARGLLRRREASATRLAHAVLAAACGDCTMPPDMLDRLLEHSADGRQVAAAQDRRTAEGLSDRECAVLKLVAAGHDTREIARELRYSTRTVTSIVQDITHRFRLRNRAHAVAYALRAGLL
jgi:DNA-binding NarL/FixJ family response regulator